MLCLGALTPTQAAFFTTVATVIPVLLVAYVVDVGRLVRSLMAPLREVQHENLRTLLEDPDPLELPWPTSSCVS